MWQKKHEFWALAAAVSALAALACTTNSMIQGCGGGTGTERLVCFDEYMEIRYDDSIGFVPGCVGSTNGSEGCKILGTNECVFTRTYRNDCTYNFYLPKTITNNVQTFEADSVPCPPNG